MDKPFAILEQWVREGRIRLSAGPIGETAIAEPEELPVGPMPEGMSDDQLFEFAMKDVRKVYIS